MDRRTLRDWRNDSPPSGSIELHPGAVGEVTHLASPVAGAVVDGVVEPALAQEVVLAGARGADRAGADAARDVERSEADAGAGVLDQHGVALAETALDDEELPGGDVGDGDRRGLGVAQRRRLGEHLVARSFKYHRPRGIYAAGSDDPAGLVQIVGEPGRTDPNTRATEQEIYEGLAATSQNHWPSLRFDIGAVNDLISPFIPAGFYYKTFKGPLGNWMTFEPFIRAAAGLG